MPQLVNLVPKLVSSLVSYHMHTQHPPFTIQLSTYPSITYLRPSKPANPFQTRIMRNLVHLYHILVRQLVHPL